MPLAGQQAFGEEVEPLEVLAGEVLADRQLHLPGVAGIHDLDIAAVEIAANLHGLALCTGCQGG
ncbi:hypothetical protein D3C84_1093640 [compost metagenome]